MLQESPGALRRRLFNPPNAKPDEGIDLRRRFKPQPESKAPENPILQIQKITLAQAMFDWNCLQYFNSCFENHPQSVCAPVEQRNQILIARIIGTVARHYSITPNDLISARRTQNVVRPRQIVMWLSKELTPHSLPEIGRRLGGRDHTTILHGFRKIDRLRQVVPELQAQLDQFCTALRSTSTENSNADDQPPISAVR